MVQYGMYSKEQRAELNLTAHWAPVVQHDGDIAQKALIYGIESKRDTDNKREILLVGMVVQTRQNIKVAIPRFSVHSEMIQELAERVGEMMENGTWVPESVLVDGYEGSLRLLLKEDVVTHETALWVPLSEKDEGVTAKASVFALSRQKENPGIRKVATMTVSRDGEVNYSFKLNSPVTGFRVGLTKMWSELQLDRPGGWSSISDHYVEDCPCVYGIVHTEVASIGYVDAFTDNEDDEGFVIVKVVRMTNGEVVNVFLDELARYDEPVLGSVALLSDR